MNKRGSHGIINCTGSPGDPSELVDCRERDFLQNIEEGIKSTVIVILNKGLFTLSSCQGHAISCPYRCVSIVDDITIIRWIQQSVYTINQTELYKIPISYYILPYQDECKLYPGCFENPYIIDINFGDFRDDETITKQISFEMFLKEHTVEAIEKQLTNDIVKYRLPNDNHIDVFTHTD